MSKARKLLGRLAEAKYKVGQIWLSRKTEEIRIITKVDEVVPGYRQLVFTYYSKGDVGSDALTTDSLTRWVKNHNAQEIVDKTKRKELIDKIKDSAPTGYVQYAVKDLPKS